MKMRIKAFASLAAVALAALPGLTAAETAPAIPAPLVTPDRVESSFGALEFRDGAPGKETVAKVCDNIDYTKEKVYG